MGCCLRKVLRSGHEEVESQRLKRWLRVAHEIDTWDLEIS